MTDVHFICNFMNADSAFVSDKLIDPIRSPTSTCYSRRERRSRSSMLTCISLDFKLSDKKRNQRSCHPLILTIHWNVKFSFPLIEKVPRHEDVSRSGVTVLPFLTTELNEGEWPSSSSDYFHPCKKKAPTTNCVRGCVVPTDGLEKNLIPCWEQNPVLSANRCYNFSAIPGPV